MDLGLKDRVAMVTGSSRGIGRAIAFALAEEGASLALCSRSEKEIKRTAEEVSSLYGTKIYAGAWDLLIPEATQRFVEEAVKTLGHHMDILVNNVGGGIARFFDDLTEKDWQEALEKNFWVALRCSRAVLPQMKAHGSGKIINIAALSGKLPRFGQIGSNVAKAALINLTESLAYEVGRFGIRVNAVCPAIVWTERWEGRVRQLAQQKGKSYDATREELARTTIPVGRFGTPEDVASLVAFLASDKSDFINGVSIEVDGGLGRSLRLEI